MYNSYLNSTSLSLRCNNGSLSFSFNDYSYFLNDSNRFDTNPTTFSSQSCCACCSNSKCRVPIISPSILYGLRQSNLIQWSASRRLIFSYGDRYYCRFPASYSCCCVPVGPPLKERGVGGRRRRFRSMVSEEKSERHRLSYDDDVEVMLSLLTEEVGEECFRVGERNGRSSRRVEVENRGSGSGASYRKKKKNVSSGLSESNSKQEFESVMIKLGEEHCKQKEDRRKEDKEHNVRSEKHKTRKEGSSCSSYYSCSSLGEFESDNEVQLKQERYRGESESGEAAYDGEYVAEVKRHEDVGGARVRQEKTSLGSYATSSGVECDWRKKSEKKLTEVLVEKTETREKSSNKHMGKLDVHETGYRQDSSSHHQFDNMEEKSAFVGSTNDETRQQYSRKGDQITRPSESRMKYKSDIEAISEKRFSGRDKNLSETGSFGKETRYEHTNSAGLTSRREGYRRNSQQLNEVSKIQENNVRGTSTSPRQSEARVKKQEDETTVVLSGIQDMEERHDITSHLESRQDSRRKFQQLAEISDTHYLDISNTSSSSRQSDNLISGSSAQAKEQHFQTGQQLIRKTEKGSQDVSNTSITQSTDSQFADTKRTSEKRISSQETYSASVAKSTEKISEQHNLTEERFLQIGSTKETQKPSKSLSFREGTSKVASSYQTSSVLKMQPTEQRIGVDVGDKSYSQATVMAPPSQLVARGPLYVEPTSDFAIQKVSSASLESGSDALHTRTELTSPASQHEIYGAGRGDTHEEALNFITQEDALGSADRLQKSSMHFVGEFVEKVTQEISISEVQKEKTISEKELVNEGHKHQQKSLSEYGSGDLKSKEHDSRLSSRSSGVKGPSVEIWDVTDPPIQEPSGTEALESTTPTTNVIAKGTGRSLWTVISDIVRFRWAAHSASHNSTLKSGERSSPNQSASSEAWFSGHERDDNSNENMKREKKSMSQDSMSADHQHLVTIPTGGQVSSSASTKDKIDQVGVDALSSSGVFESASASKGISSVSSEENFRSGTAMVESSASMPSLRIRRSPLVDEISETGKIDSGSLVHKEQGLTDVSRAEGKGGELKQRKLQRNNQVLKDRFDEWEEAYVLEREQQKIDEMFMREALLEAKKAADIWEVPVGAVLVQHGKIIARGCNLVEELRDSTAHAEMICIREASNQLHTWRLSETTLYVTLEPCPMCAGAVLQARIDTVVWGAPNKLLGADGSWIRLFPNGGEGGSGLEPSDKPPAPVHPFHPKMAIRRGVLAAECADVMQQFFQLRRRKKEKKPDPPIPPSRLPVSHHPSKLLTKLHDAFHFMFCL